MRKATLVVHNANSEHGRRQLILWLERQARFLRKTATKRLSKRFTARLFVDKDSTMETRRSKVH